jgi:hypothetical protein
VAKPADRSEQELAEVVADEVPSDDTASQPSIEASDPFFSISPRTVAFVAVLIAIASVATLTVVAELEDADALSTVALALAILAFSIQIMVFIAQERTASEQAQHAERLNAETRALLTDISATAKSTAAMVGEQYRRVLEAALGGAADAVKESKGGENFDPRLVESITRALREAPPAASSEGADAPVPASQPGYRSRRSRPLTPHAAQAIRVLRSFPSDEQVLRDAAGKLANLSAQAQEELKEAGRDELSSLTTGTYVGLPADESPGERELLGAGLIEHYDRRTGNETNRLARLTDAGREVARLLTALGEVPAVVSQAIRTDEE